MEGKLKHPKTTAFVLLLSAFMCSADTMTLQPILELLSTDVFPDAGYAKVSMYRRGRVRCPSTEKRPHFASFSTSSR